MICPYNDGTIIRTRDFEYDKVTGKIIKQIEKVQQVPIKCLGDECPFYDRRSYSYDDISCRRVVNDIGEDI